MEIRKERRMVEGMARKKIQFVVVLVVVVVVVIVIVIALAVVVVIALAVVIVIALAVVIVEKKVEGMERKTRRIRKRRIVWV